LEKCEQAKDAPSWLFAQKDARGNWGGWEHCLAVFCHLWACFSDLLQCSGGDGTDAKNLPRASQSAQLAQAIHAHSGRALGRQKDNKIPVAQTLWAA